MHQERGGTTLHARPFSTASRRSSIYEKVCHALPKFLRKPLSAWWDRVMMVLSPEWFTTTVLVWSTWCAMALGKFGHYLFDSVRCLTHVRIYHVQRLSPKVAGNEERHGPGPNSDGKSVGSVGIHYWRSSWFSSTFSRLRIVVNLKHLFEQLGAYLIESSLGRKWSLAGSTFVTAFFCVIFARVTSTWGVRLSTIGISLSSTVNFLFLSSSSFPVIWMLNVMLIHKGDVGDIVWLDARNLWNQR